MDGGSDRDRLQAHPQHSVRGSGRLPNSQRPSAFTGVMAAAPSKLACEPISWMPEI